MKTHQESGVRQKKKKQLDLEKISLKQSSEYNMTQLLYGRHVVAVLNILNQSVETVEASVPY